MALLFDEGLTSIAKGGLGVSPTPTLELRLFTSTNTPAAGDTNAAYTYATNSGYAHSTLTAASWSSTVTSSVSVNTYPQTSFTFSGGDGSPNTIRGWTIFNTANSKLISGGLLASPIVNPATGMVVKITPSINLQNC